MPVSAAAAPRAGTRALARSASPRPTSGCAPIRTSSPAACASAWPSPSPCCTSRELIIADEPTTALDVTIQGQILVEVQRLCRDSGTALIWITHDLAVVAGLADRIAVMYAGRIVELGTAADIIDAAAAPLHARACSDRCRGEHAAARARPDSRHDALTPQIAARLLRSARAAPCAIDKCAAMPALDGHRPGQFARCWRAVARPTAPDPLPARHLASASSSVSISPARSPTRFGAGLRETVVQAVDDVDLDVAEGEVVGLVGESGCGKCTLGRIVGRHPAPSDGSCCGAARCRGDGGAERSAWQLAVQMIFQDPVCLAQPAPAGRRIVGEAPLVHGIVRARRGAIRGRDARQVGLDPAYASRYPHQFSGGQRAADRHRPRAGGEACLPRLRRGGGGARRFDPGASAEPVHGFAPAARPHLSLHQPRSGVVEHLSDRVAIMYLGRLVEIAPADGTVRPSQPSLHAGAAGRSAEARRGAPDLPADRAANFPRRSTRRPAAPSTRAAHTPCRAARSKGRR